MGKYSNDELVARAFTSEFRANVDEDGKKVVHGTPIVFNQDTILRDAFGEEFIERIDPHALDGANLKDVLLLVNHDFNKIPLARSKNGNLNSTMKFEITANGMEIDAILDTDHNSESEAVYSAVKRGDMDGMSFYFRIQEQIWNHLDDGQTPVRTITKISIVHEVSIVNFPAYTQTSVEARSLAETKHSALEEARKLHAEEIAKRSKTELNLEIEKLKLILNL